MRCKRSLLEQGAASDRQLSHRHLHGMVVGLLKHYTEGKRMSWAIKRNVCSLQEMAKIFLPVSMVTRTSATPSHLHLQHHHHHHPPPPQPPSMAIFNSFSSSACPASYSYSSNANVSSCYSGGSTQPQRAAATSLWYDGSSVHVACAARSINNDKIAFPHMDRANVVFDSDFGLGLAFGFGFGYGYGFGL